jgi:LPS-assembly protein
MQLKLWLIFFFLFWIRTGFAQSGLNSARLQGISVSAESFSQDSDNQTVDLEGNVQVIYEDQHLKCDRARINLRAKSVDAIGNVTLVTPRAIIGGERITLDYGTDTGLIFNGYVQSGSVLFQGELIRKLSNQEYLTDDSFYTTCTNCPETWGFSGSVIRAELGGYAYIKNSVLRFGGVPVFWLPYMMVPLKSDRQTGLLTPGYETSDSGGLTFSQPFFWAMSRSQDSTWTLKNYELRGLKGLANYRYVLNPHIKGEFNFSFLRDRAFSNSSRLKNFQPTNQQGTLLDRWTLNYAHYYELPDGYINRININNSSDLQYPKDFPEETGIAGYPAMESRMNLTKNTADDHWLIDTSYYKTMLRSDPLAGNSESVHRLPEISYSRKHSRIAESNFIYSFDVNYLNLARTTQSYDDMNRRYELYLPTDPGYDPENPKKPKPRYLNNDCDAQHGSDWEKYPGCRYVRDGVYDPNKDLIRTGQRLDIKPSIYRPIRANFLEVLPKLTYRETIYNFDVGENRTNTRRYVRGEVSARTTLSRIYGDLRSVKSPRMKHEMQPELTFTTIPWMHHPEHPFFGSLRTTEEQFSNSGNVSDSDLHSANGIQFDTNDRVSDRKLYTFALVNRWISKEWELGIPTYHQFLTWRLAQSYDAFQAEKDPDSLPWSDLLSDVQLNIGTYQVYYRANYFYHHQRANEDLRLRYLFPAGDYVEIGHVLQHPGIGGRADIVNKARSENYSLSFRKDLPFANVLGQFTYNANVTDDSDPLKSWGYGAQFKLPGDCWFLTFKQFKVTGGERISRIDFEFFFDGNSKPKLDESFLAQLPR